VNNAIQQLNQVTQQNAAASEEMATSSEELAGQAEALLEMISFFKLDNGSTKQAVVKKPAVTQTTQKTESRNGSRVSETLRSVSRDLSSNKKMSHTPSNGVHLSMGKDHLDSSYEKF
jgi:methyl-accepting chemotaxis protein